MGFCQLGPTNVKNIHWLCMYEAYDTAAMCIYTLTHALGVFC